MHAPKLTLLHTAKVQADAFAKRLARRGIEARHEVRPDLLARAMSGGIDDALGAEIDNWLMSARRTSDAVLCTCSTLGPRVDAQADPRLLRIDRPLMRAAAEIEEPVLLTYCLASTANASRALLNEERDRAGHASTVTELHLEAAWAEFEAGDMPAYHRLIATSINDQLARTSRARTVILAQASMADAAKLIQAERVFSAPELALDAVLAC